MAKWRVYVGPVSVKAVASALKSQQIVSEVIEGTENVIFCTPHNHYDELIAWGNLCCPLLTKTWLKQPAPGFPGGVYMISR